MSARALLALRCAAAVLLAQVLLARAEPLVLAVSRGPVSLPIYVAQAKGYFKAEGVAVQLRDCTSGRSCLESMMQGHAQVATAAELAVTLASFKRDDIAILGTMSTSSHQIKLVARRSAGIHGANHMKGQRVGVVPGSSAQYFLDTWVTFHGIDPRAMKQIPREPGQLVEALAQHQVDAVAVWEPHASKAIEALDADAVVMPNPRVYMQHFALVTDRMRLSHRSRELSQLLQALVKAERFIAARPADAVAVLQEQLRIDAATAAAQMKEHDYRIRLDQSLISTMEEQSRWAIREGLADAHQRPASLLLVIEPALLRASFPRAVSLVR